MPAIHVDVSGDHERIGREAGVHRVPIIHTTADWIVDALEHGMQSGATSLMVMIPANVEGTDVLVMAETSLQCWMMASSVLAARFEAEVNRPGWAVLSDATRALLLPRFAEALRRVIPSCTEPQSLEAAELFLDGLSAGAPPDLFGEAG